MLMSKKAVNETKKYKLYFTTILVLITLIDLVLILNANRKRYTVIFLDGDMISPVIVLENNKVNPLENKNEHFLGWYLNDYKYDFNEIVKSDIVLKAKYEEETNYTVTFDSDGGEPISPIIVKANKTLVEPTEPTKENYVFKYWLLDDTIYDFNTPVTSDMVLTALWEEIPDSEKIYTITFDSDGGSEVKPIKVMAESYASKPDDPTKTGYTFSGWYLDNKLYSWNFKITTNVNLIAKWKAKTKLKITFNSDGGTKLDPITAYKNETVELPVPTKAGYVFGGWYYRKTKYTNQTKITSSVTLTAKWLSNDEANAIAAIESIKSSYEILKGGTKIRCFSFFKSSKHFLFASSNVGPNCLTSAPYPLVAATLA